jgi:hypothetical protein
MSEVTRLLGEGFSDAVSFPGSGAKLQLAHRWRGRHMGDA